MLCCVPGIFLCGLSAAGSAPAAWGCCGGNPRAEGWSTPILESHSVSLWFGTFWGSWCRVRGWGSCQAPKLFQPGGKSAVLPFLGWETAARRTIKVIKCQAEIKLPFPLFFFLFSPPGCAVCRCCSGSWGAALRASQRVWIWDGELFGVPPRAFGGPSHSSGSSRTDGMGSFPVQGAKQFCVPSLGCVPSPLLGAGCR